MIKNHWKAFCSTAEHVLRAASLQLDCQSPVCSLSSKLPLSKPVRSRRLQHRRSFQGPNCASTEAGHISAIFSDSTQRLLLCAALACYFPLLLIQELSQHLPTEEGNTKVSGITQWKNDIFHLFCLHLEPKTVQDKLFFGFVSVIIRLILGNFKHKNLNIMNIL